MVARRFFKLVMQERIWEVVRMKERETRRIAFAGSFLIIILTAVICYCGVMLFHNYEVVYANEAPTKITHIQTPTNSTTSSDNSSQISQVSK